LRFTRSNFVLAIFAVLLIITAMFFSLAVVESQYTMLFSTTDRFNIPALNGSIRFAHNGSYSSATMENSTWIFKDLRFNNVMNNSALGNLQISVQDSNITIFSFYSSNNISMTRQNVRYFAEGAGTQVVYLGINKTTHYSEWWVTFNAPTSIFLAQGREWQLFPNNTVIVHGQTGNISITHSNFGTSEDSNLPFYQRHSITIITAVLFAATITIASILRLKVKKKACA